MRIIITACLLLAMHYAIAASVNLAWDATVPTANNPTLPSGYKIAYGTSSGVYDNSVDVGNVTTALLDGLQDNVQYFIAAQAYATAENVVSVYSNEITFMHVVVPQTDPADTLGNSGIGSSIDSSNSNYINASRVITGSDGFAVESISAHVGSVSAAPNNLFQVAIYADANGVPGALIANSKSTALTANAWSTAPISATLSANTAYWLAFNTNGTKSSVNNLHYDVVPGAGAWRTKGQLFGTWPQLFGSATMADTAFSIFATGAKVASIQPPTNLTIAP